VGWYRRPGGDLTQHDVPRPLTTELSGGAHDRAADRRGPR
jgi:hypothetical protein